MNSFYEFIRKKTYMLANHFEKKSKLLSTENIKIKKTAKKITAQRNVESFIKEVDLSLIHI